MAEKVYCKDCICVELRTEEQIFDTNNLPETIFLCHRKAGPAQRVDRYGWCFEGIYRYGDKEE